MTTQTPNHALANEVMQATAETLAYLRNRYSDEKGYESLQDYTASLQKRIAAETATIEKMTARPFGFIWFGSDGFRRHTYIKRNTVETKRVTVAPSFIK